MALLKTRGFRGSKDSEERYSDSKESVRNVGDLGSVTGLRRSTGGEHGNPLQYSCLENLMDRGAWWALVLRVTEIRTQWK